MPRMKANIKIQTKDNGMTQKIHSGLTFSSLLIYCLYDCHIVTVKTYLLIGNAKIK